MALSMQLWEIAGERLVPIESTSLNLEKRLEDWLENDISIIGIDILIIGRQVRTDYGGYIDLIGIDGEGHIIIIELKRRRTPRDIIAQCLDYGSWIYALQLEDVISIFESFSKGKILGEVFETFYGSPLPDDLPKEYQILIVAETLDDATERIVHHINEAYNVNINAVFFNLFSHNGHEFVGRSWLQDPAEVEDNVEKRKNKVSTGYRFVNTGIDEGKKRDWKNNIEFGYISAGGGARWINAIRRLRKEDKIFALIKGKGYVGYGIVEEEAILVKNFIVHGQKITDQLESGHPWKQEKDPLKDEWLVRVKWVKTYPENEARWFKGAFANQNVVCELRDMKTFEFLRKEFEIGKEE